MPVRKSQIILRDPILSSPHRARLFDEVFRDGGHSGLPGNNASIIGIENEG